MEPLEQMRQRERAPEEAGLAEVRGALRDLLKECRRRHRISQQDLAERLGTGQARVSRIERADPSVSTDQLLKALLVAGATREEIAGVIAGPQGPWERSTGRYST